MYHGTVLVVKFTTDRLALGLLPIKTLSVICLTRHVSLCGWLNQIKSKSNQINFFYIAPFIHVKVQPKVIKTTMVLPATSTACVNRDNHECSHMNICLAVLLAHPILVSWFILNCLNLSLWLKAWLAHYIPHTNKLNQMSVNTMDSKQKITVWWGNCHLFILIELMIYDYL